MTNESYNIRPIKLEDNQQIAARIREILIEFGAPKVGTAYEDKALDSLFETYLKPKSAYFIIENEQMILGGAGIAQLENCEENICELQKMYFAPTARGKGLGSKMIALCLEKAKEFGYDQCYLETLPYMESARKLYTRNGFKSLDAPVGDTGHYSCNMWMIKDL